MHSFISYLKSRDAAILFGLVFLSFVLLLFPANVTFIISSIIFVAFAYLKPMQSLLYLIVYVAIRPYFIEFNSGMKLVGDLITLTLLVKLVVSAWPHPLQLFKFKKFEWAYFAFILLGAVVALWNGISTGAVIFQIRTFIIMYLIYFLLSKISLPKQFLTYSAVTMVVLGWLLSFQGIIEKVSGRQVSLPPEWRYMVLSEANSSRIYGLTGNPNTLALVLMFSIIAILYLQKQLPASKTFLTTSFAMFLGIFILTFSRGTMISAFVLAICFILLSKRWYLVKKLIVGWLLAFVLVYLPINGLTHFVQSLDLEFPAGPKGTLIERLEQTFDDKNLERMNENGRIFYMKKSFEIWKDHPITGAGFGTFGGAATISYGSPIYEQYGIDISIYAKNKIYSDNQYVQIIAETGSLGVILFACFLLFMLAIFIRNRHDLFSQFMIALWFSTGVSGFYYNIWELKVYTLLFFLLLGIYMSQLDKPKLKLHSNDNK